MAITLGQLRTYCAEAASKDASGATADREFMRWINAALARLFAETSWDRSLREKKITVTPEVSGTDLVATLGSGTFTSASGPFTAAMATEGHDLLIVGEDRFVPRIETRTDANTVVARSGDEWVQASGTGKTFYVLKTRYELTDAARVERVENVLNPGHCLEVLTPAAFDTVKRQTGAQRGATPRWACFRQGHLEVWPHPGPDYAKLSITYRKSFTPIADAELDATEVDWEERDLDVLQAAIRLEAAINQGEDAPVPYAVALQEYGLRIHNAKALSQRINPAGPMNVQVPTLSPRRPRSWAFGTFGDAP